MWQHVRSPEINCVIGVFAVQGADKFGPVLRRIAEWERHGVGFELIVGQRCLGVLQRDRTVEAEAVGLAAEGCYRDRIVEHIMQPMQPRGLWKDDQLAPDQAQIVTLARAEHHAMFAQPNQPRIAIDCGMPDGQQAHSSH